MGNSVSFNQKVFYSKDAFADFLRSKLKNGKLSDADKDELEELYYQGAFKLFGFQNNNAEFKSETLAEISSFFNLENNIKLNIIDYLNIEEVTIPLLDGEIIKDDTGLSFSVTSLKLESIPSSTENPIIFSLKYFVKKTANQIVSPTLFFYEGENKTRAYETTDINLSYECDGIVEFKIPLIDLIQNNAGIYIISCNGSELCRINVPKIKLPLGNEGVGSYEELISFLDWKYQDWTPSGILLPFYDLVRYRVLDTWLRDKGENLKEQLENWDANSHDISINDIDQVLSLLGSKARINLRMGYYFDIEVLDVSSTDCFYKDDVDNCYFKWDSCNEVNISFKIKPKVQLNLNFDLGIRLSDMNTDGDRYILIELKEPILFNLESITEEYIYSCSFNSNSFSRNKMSYYYLEFVNNASTDDHEISSHRIVLAGEPVILTLPKGEEIKMVGIPGGRDFYISANPITRKQLKCLIGENASNELKSVLARSQSYFGDDVNSPATFFSYSSCEELISALNRINTKFHFRIPSWFELASAFGYGGYYDRDKDDLCINFPTILGISNLPGVSFLQTSDLGDSIFSTKRILFGSRQSQLSFAVKELKAEKVEYKESDFATYETNTGLFPIMEIEKTYPKRDYETNDVVDADTWLADRWTTEIDF